MIQMVHGDGNQVEAIVQSLRLTVAGIVVKKI
jgi:hypothetical protein